MTSLKKLYDTVVKDFEVDMALVEETSPINVYILTTACESVTRYYMDKLSESVRSKFVEKMSLSGLLRQLVHNMESGETKASADEALYAEYRSFPDNNVKVIPKVKKLVSELKRAVRDGKEVRVGPRFEFNKNPYYRYITAGTDLAVVHKHKMFMVQVSTAKEYSEYTSPASSETALLLKILLGFITYPEITDIQYRVALTGSVSAKDVCFELAARDLTEDPETTVLRLITFYSKERKVKGNECILCPHRNYCPLLEDALEEYASEVPDDDNKED